MSPTRAGPVALPRALAVTGMGAIAAGVVLVGLLHVVPPSSYLSPTRRTISEYALLESGLVFNVAVLLLAAGSVATAFALVTARMVAPASGAAVALLTWAGGLAGVAYFPKHNWAVGPSVEGEIHRWASVVAFLSLPVAALLLARVWWAHPQWRTQAVWSTVLGVLALLCLSPIAVAFAAEPYTGVPWWRAIPLGGVERVLALTEVVTVFVFAVWAARAGRGPAAPVDRSPAGEPMSG